MEKPNLKKEALAILNRVDEKEVSGIIQIVLREDGDSAICMGGNPKQLSAILTFMIKDNEQVRKIFEEALINSIEID